MKIHIIKQGDTLYNLAQKYHVTVNDLLNLNPGVDPHNLQIGAKIKIPSSSSGHPGGASHFEIIHQHVCKSGDTLWKLSQEWGVSLADLTAANAHIKNPNMLMQGDIINIPKTGSTQGGTVSAHATSISSLFGTQNEASMPTAGSIIEQLVPGFQMYTVVAGDTLYGIANNYGITLDELTALNPSVGDPTQLQIGTKLLVPKVASAPGGGSHSGIGFTKNYTVKPGDTLWKLSQAWNVSLDALIAANSQLSNPDQLTPGQVIHVPHNVSLGGGLHAQSNAKANMISPTGKKNTGVIPKSDTNVKGTAPVAPVPIKVQLAPTAKTEVKPTKVQPQAAKVEPITTKVEPLATKVQPQATKVEPLATKVQPQATKVEPLATKVQPQAAKVEPLATKVQPQATKVEPLATKVQPQAAKVEPLATKVQPQATKVQPLATKVEAANKIMPQATGIPSAYSNNVAPLATGNPSAYSNNVAPLATGNPSAYSNNIAPYSNTAANKIMPQTTKLEAANKIMPQSQGNQSAYSNNVAPLATGNPSAYSNNIAPYANTAANKIMPQATKLEATNKIMPQSYGNPSAYSNNVAPLATGNASAYSNNIAPLATGNASAYSNNVAPLATGNASAYSNNVAPLATGNASAYSNNVAPLATGNASAYSNNVAPLATGNASAYSNNIAPYANTAANKIMPQATKLEAANKIMPQSYGNQSAYSNNVAPLATGNPSAFSNNSAAYGNTIAPYSTTKIQATANKMAPLAANSIAPYAANKMAPAAANSIAPYAANKMAPAAANSIAPYAANKMAPAAANSIAPLSANKMAPATANSIAPLSANKMAPLAANSIAPLSANKMAPLAANSIAPLSANKMAPAAANKMAGYGNQNYAGYKPLPQELQQQAYSMNTANTKAYTAANHGYTAYNSPYYYPQSTNAVYPNQSNWGYVQPMNASSNMMPMAMGMPNGNQIMAQSAMYPPSNLPQQPTYYQPYQADCGCGGTQANKYGAMNASANQYGAMNASANQYATMNDAAVNKFAPLNQAAAKVAPNSMKGKRSGKKLNITAAKSKAKKSRKGKPWLNV